MECPHCGKAFTVDESGYAAILNQVRDQEFQRKDRSHLAWLERQGAHPEQALAGKGPAGAEGGQGYEQSRGVPQTASEQHGRHDHGAQAADQVEAVALSGASGDGDAQDEGGKQPERGEEEVGFRERCQSGPHEGPTRQQHVLAPYAQSVRAQVQAGAYGNKRPASVQVRTLPVQAHTPSPYSPLLY